MINHNSSALVRVRRRDPARERFWRDTLCEFASSGQSVRAFCAGRNLSEPTFYAWRSELARRDPEGSSLARRDNRTPSTGRASAAGRDRRGPAPAFLPIRLADANVAPVEVALAGGCCLRLRPPIDRQALVEILSALASVGIVPPRSEA